MIRRFGPLSVFLLAATVGACDSSTATCAPDGTYAPTATRSADPGSCPADLELWFEWANLEIGSVNHACGIDEIELSGRITSSSLIYCSYAGTVLATSSSDGISAKAKLTFQACPGKDAPTCQANFDFAYTRL